MNHWQMPLPQPLVLPLETMVALFNVVYVSGEVVGRCNFLKSTKIFPLESLTCLKKHYF